MPKRPLTVSLTYLGKHAEDVAAVCIYDLPAWAVGETRTVSTALAARITADFPVFFGAPPADPPVTPSSTPDAPAQES